MRISSNTLFDSAVNRMGDQSVALNKIQQQLSTGQKIQSPADDPLGASRVLQISQGQAINAQLAENRTSAKNTLTQQESVLQSVTDVLLGIQEQVVAASNATYDATDRKILATELRVRLQDLTGLANSRDSVGNYLFAGFKDNEQPFTGAGATTSYRGDNGLKLAQVGSQRQMPVNDTGDAVFMNVPSKSFDSVSSGSMMLSTARLADVSQSKPGHSYQVAFDGAGGYKVFDTTLDPTKAGTPVASGPYSNSQSVRVDGIDLAFSGADVAGDTIDITPARNQSMFKSIGDLIDTLEMPVATDADRIKLGSSLDQAGENMTSALNHILSVRASGGARLQEIDSLDAAGSARDLQYADQLSGIQDLDYVKAISDLTQRQQNLQAAQQSFAKVSGLSLFNYL